MSTKEDEFIEDLEQTIKKVRPWRVWAALFGFAILSAVPIVLIVLAIGWAF